MRSADRVALVTVVDATGSEDRTQVIGYGNRFGNSPTIFRHRVQTVWFRVDRTIKGDDIDCVADTVETYRGRLMQKLQLDDLVALVKFAIRNGMSSVD